MPAKKRKATKAQRKTAKTKKKPAARKIKEPAWVERLRKGMAKQTKAELIETLVNFARRDRKTQRELEKQFHVQTPADDLVAVTRQAIADATDFDEREINYNFDYDMEAYDIVERNLERLVELGALEDAMELSLELMRRGSYQIEMSDEGMMTDDVEGCLDVVIDALHDADLPAEKVAQWCDAMTRADRVGFVCEKELQQLRRQFRG